MDDIPSKAKSHLGAIAEVNLHIEDGKYFIESITPRYSNPEHFLLITKKLNPETRQGSGVNITTDLA